MPFEIKQSSDLSTAQKRVYERAKAAIAQKNYGYAFEMLRTMLLADPGCTEVRNTLRISQLERIGGGLGLPAKILAQLKTAFPVFIKGPLLTKRGKLAEALDVAEKAMEADPSAIPTLHFLHGCAKAAGLVEPATESLEICNRFNPKHVGTLRKMIAHFREINDVSKTLQALQQLRGLLPNDLRIENELKQATAAAAMNQGNWEKADSFRDIIKDKDLAQTLEQQERIAARDTGTLASLVKAAEEALAAQPIAANHKKLADLYHQDRQYDKALEQYRLVEEKLGSLDPAIDNAITRIMMDRFDDAIKQWREYAANDDSKRAEADAQIADIEQQKAETKLSRYRERVERYPNDSTYHFELGVLYFERKEFDLALKELQIAQRNPQLQAKALVFKGKAMAAKDLTDMAIEQLATALPLLQRMDNERKDVLYTLALLHAETGNDAAKLEHLKEIYAVDVNYRDTGALIEGHYRKAKETGDTAAAATNS